MVGTKNKPTFVGPHEGRELELMTAGTKPLSMFVDSIPRDFECFAEEEFDALVSQGKLVKKVTVEDVINSIGEKSQIRRTLYALPNERWRIDAVLMLQGLYDSLPKGWHPDLDRAIGLLLGYNRSDIEDFLKWRDRA